MNKTNVFLSIIIPVYNVELFIEECLISLLKQKDKDFELIIIDDGSTDSSVRIVKEYMPKFERVTLLSINNSGQSIARNIGIDKAIGEYVYFLDSDDYISDDTVLKAKSIIKEKKLDALLFGGAAFSDHSMEEELKGFEYDRVESLKISNGRQAFNMMMNHNNYIVQPCCYMTKLNIAKKIKFHPNVYHEDNAFMTQLLLSDDMKRTMSIEDKFFCRRVRVNSTMTKPKNHKHYNGYLECAKYLTTAISSELDELTKVNLISYLYRVVNALIIVGVSIPLRLKIITKDVIGIFLSLNEKSYARITTCVMFKIPYLFLRKLIINNLRKYNVLIK